MFCLSHVPKGEAGFQLLLAALLYSPIVVVVSAPYIYANGLEIVYDSL